MFKIHNIGLVIAVLGCSITGAMIFGRQGLWIGLVVGATEAVWIVLRNRRRKS